MIAWENPPTTVFVEMKYLSGLSTHVSGDDGESGFPSDQLIRNIRVGLHRSRWFRADDQLFALPPQDLVVLVLAPAKGHPLVDHYRGPERLRAAIPHAHRLMGLPRPPFVAELGYSDSIDLLQRQSRWFTRAERRVAEDLVAYLEFKLTAAQERSGTRNHTDILKHGTLNLSSSESCHPSDLVELT